MRETTVQLASGHTFMYPGFSLAGLYAARICADHFEEVVVLDPDNDPLCAAAGLAPERPEQHKNEKWNPRPRVYQTRSIHASQVLHMLGLERLFPGFEKELQARNVSCVTR